MKTNRLTALLLSSIIFIIAACGCSATPVQEHTNVTNPETAAIVETESPANEETFDRINPSVQTEATDITPFGNTPGIIVSNSQEIALPDKSVSYSYQQMFFKTEGINFSAAWDTYLVDGYIEKTEKLLSVMEQVIGLSFLQEETELNIHLTAPGSSGYSEPAARTIGIEQIDAFMGNSANLIAYLADVLQDVQPHEAFCDVLRYGFMTYSTYQVLTWLETHDPEFAVLFSDKENWYMNYLIRDADETLYSQDMVHWMEQGYPYDRSNGSAALGFWFMKYLDETCGDYTRWIMEYSKKYPSAKSDILADLNLQIQNLQDVYGENILEGFYPWLKDNLNLDAMWDTADYSALREYVHYPVFSNIGYYDRFFCGNYKDLVISLSEFRYYMTEVKGYTLEHLTLAKSTDTEVVLYDVEGKYLLTTQGVETAEGEYRVFLEDAHYIGLPGEGFLDARLLLE